MASFNLIKMSLIYFNSHKDLLIKKFNKLTKLWVLHAQSSRLQYLEHEIFYFAKIKYILHVHYVNTKR